MRCRACPPSLVLPACCLLLAWLLLAACLLACCLLADAGLCGARPRRPCRKCACLLHALGVRHVAHSTGNGRLVHLLLPPQRPELLAVGMAKQPLKYACDAAGVRCEALEAALLEPEPPPAPRQRAPPPGQQQQREVAECAECA